jgi:HEAT repeat protein
LAEACRDPEPEVRFRAAAALGHQNDRRATPVLIEMLYGPELFVDAALGALNTVLDPAAFDRVSELYKAKQSGVARNLVLTTVYQRLKHVREKSQGQ